MSGTLSESFPYFHSSLQESSFEDALQPRDTLSQRDARSRRKSNATVIRPFISFFLLFPTQRSFAEAARPRMWPAVACEEYQNHLSGVAEIASFVAS